MLSPVLTLVSHPSPAVRAASLQLVATAAGLPHAAAFPFRPQVIRGLAAPLGDSKRAVRRLAVLARNEWFVLGAPGA
jgi:hypothetical protein